MKNITMLAVLTAVCIALPAAAQDKPDRIVDITDPAVVAKILQDEGYKGVLKKHDDGEPYIESAANGSAFTIEFFNCKSGKTCSSLQFYSWYKKEPFYSVDLANRWNARKRFIKAAIDKDGDLATYMDITALGKTTQANFADHIDWWSVMTGELFKFLDEEEEGAGGEKPVKK